MELRKNKTNKTFFNVTCEKQARGTQAFFYCRTNQTSGHKNNHTQKQTNKKKQSECTRKRMKHVKHSKSLSDVELPQIAKIAYYSGRSKPMSLKKVGRGCMVYTTTREQSRQNVM